MISQDVGIINNLKIEDLYRRQVLMDDNRSYYVDVFDMAGQEEYTALPEQDIRDREGFVIVYSVASRSSFARIAKSYNQICLILKPGSTLARELRCDFVEVSAKNYVNVENMFYNLVRQMHSKRLGELGRLGNLQEGPAVHGSCFKEASKISRFCDVLDLGDLGKFGR